MTRALRNSTAPVALARQAPVVRLWLAALLCIGIACVARDEAPDAAYRAFARAMARRDADRAWDLLSSDTRAWLDARARAVAAAAPGVIPPSGEQLLVGNASRAARPLRSVVVLRESRDRAVVTVQEEGGAPHEVELVREGSWRVRIPSPPT